MNKRKQKLPSKRWWEHKGRDTTMYYFRNNRTDNTFFGERCEFYRKFNLDQGAVSHLIKGKRKQHKGWIFLQKGEIK